MDLPPVTAIEATLQIEELAQEVEKCSSSEHPAARAAPVSQTREGVSVPNCSQFWQRSRKCVLESIRHSQRAVRRLSGWQIPCEPAPHDGDEHAERPSYRTALPASRPDRKNVVEGERL